MPRRVVLEGAGPGSRVLVVLEGAGPGFRVPAHMTRVPISLIATDADFSQRTVQGTVVRKGRLVSLASGNALLKTVLQEEDAPPPNASINVVLFGALAKDFDQAVNQGDVVVASGFTVGRSPTVHKDKLHPFNLLLSGDDARVYVSRPPLPPPPPPPPLVRSPPANRKRSAAHAEVSMATKAPKYTYVGLDGLKSGLVVNTYGVVVFFKQPFRSCGTDVCSTLKITDQSNQRISCSVFDAKLENHPKVFRVGDIVRLHRFKVQFFNNSMTLVNTFGFSVLAFDGAEGGSMEPRTSSRSFHLDQEGHRAVEELRTWAAGQALLPPAPSTPLSAAQPRAYFDLTCQLLAKAPIDSTCTLLRVWDGTRCAHTLLKVTVEPDTTEGPTRFSEGRERLIANVLVYDNHVELAARLKPGDFLRIYNLRAIPGSSKVLGRPGSQQQDQEVDHLAFHLHGGTAYGRGVRVLPESSPDVQEMKRVMEAVPDEDDFSELNDSQLLEVWSTPPEFAEAESIQCSTDRSCGDDPRTARLSDLKRSDPGLVHQVRVQLRSYEPRRLHQALKLYCSKCMAMRDVPNDELVARLFSEASAAAPGPGGPPAWALSGRVPVPTERPASPPRAVGVAVPTERPASPPRAVGVHLSTQLLGEDRPTELLFLSGSTLEETRRLASGYRNVVPVRSSGGHMTLLDLSAPFLFRGRKRYFGCKRCSEASVREPLYAEGEEPLDEKGLAAALGVQLLQFVLLMKLELQDATDTLDVFLWRDAESFFGVSAEDVAANQEAENSIRQKMDSLCPAGGSAGGRPWVDLCVAAYRAEGQTCYQVCRRSITTNQRSKVTS
ncbi:protection of telomeres protein 1 [Pseudoliparis swirei]|uniref:protection of telomeres protein 1 n=1 Tax=Pseudoliparis swirei TaxID=2059687 RepID=UPI0024BDCAE5|nr:protection of telomeres protein 1 [Pseudoliparis swirei]